MPKEKAIEIFNNYLNNIEFCSKKGIVTDGKIIANLISLKYAGEDMVEVLKYAYKNLCEINRHIIGLIKVMEDED